MQTVLSLNDISRTGPKLLRSQLQAYRCLTSRTISRPSPQATRLAMRVISVESSPVLVSIGAITQVHLSKLVVFARPGPAAKPAGRKSPLVNHALPNPSNGIALFWK